MNRYLSIAVMFCLITLHGASYAEEANMIKLPSHVITGGKPLMQALQDRHSTYEYSSRALSRNT